MLLSLLWMIVCWMFTPLSLHDEVVASFHRYQSFPPKQQTRLVLGNKTTHRVAILRFEAIGGTNPMVEGGYHHFDRVPLSSLFCHRHARRSVIVKTGQGVGEGCTTFAFLLGVWYSYLQSSLVDLVHALRVVERVDVRSRFPFYGIDLGINHSWVSLLCSDRNKLVESFQNIQSCDYGWMWMTLSVVYMCVCVCVS